MSEDQPVEVLRGNGAQLEARHDELEVVERDGLPRLGLLQAELSSFIRSRDPVEEYDDVASVCIGFVDRLGKERASKRPFLGVGSLGEERELRSALCVECDVQATGCASHHRRLHGKARDVYPMLRAPRPEPAPGPPRCGR